jgi:hypothetical protein
MIAGPGGPGRASDTGKSRCCGRFALSCTAAVSAASHVRQEARSRYEGAGNDGQLRAEIAVEDTARVGGRKAAWRERKGDLPGQIVAQGSLLSASRLIVISRKGALCWTLARAAYSAAMGFMTGRGLRWRPRWPRYRLRPGGR